MVAPVTVDSIEELHADFDLFLFDQYGVLHDGSHTYPGMIDCVATLKSHGKATAVISNSGKRADYNADRLARFGFGPNLIDRVVTSGEVAWYQLERQLQDNSFGHPHARVLYIGRGSDRSAIEGLPLLETQEPDEADILLISGSEPARHALDDYAALIAPLAVRGVPAYCTNPDRWSVDAGNWQFGPGQIARCYEAAGGRVSWIGKPHAAIYAHVLAEFGLSASRVLCIGDSVEHDICGAAAAGCASLLTTTGVHEDLNADALEACYARYHATPVYMIRRPVDADPVDADSKST